MRQVLNGVGIPVRLAVAGLTCAAVALIGHTPVLACTAFCAAGAGQVLVGNNEDWHNPRTKIWFVPAKPGSYGRMYVGFDDLWPQGGMNERGLWFDGFAAPPVKATASSDLPPFPGNIVDTAMAECSTVEEVVRLFSRYSRAFLTRASSCSPTHQATRCRSKPTPWCARPAGTSCRRTFTNPARRVESRTNDSRWRRHARARGRRYFDRPVPPHPRRDAPEGRRADALLQRLRPPVADHAPVLFPRLRARGDIPSGRRVEERRARAGHPGAVPAERRRGDVRGAPEGASRGRRAGAVVIALLALPCGRSSPSRCTDGFAPGDDSASGFQCWSGRVALSSLLSALALRMHRPTSAPWIEFSIGPAAGKSVAHQPTHDAVQRHHPQGGGGHRLRHAVRSRDRTAVAGRHALLHQRGRRRRRVGVLSLAAAAGIEEPSAPGDTRRSPSVRGVRAHRDRRTASRALARSEPEHLDSANETRSSRRRLHGTAGFSVTEHSGQARDRRDGHHRFVQPGARMGRGSRRVGDGGPP